MSNKKTLVKILGVVIALVVLGAVAYTVSRDSSRNDNNSASTQTKQQDTANRPEDSEKSEQKQQTTIISGTAVYPSEVYPADYKVCALNATTEAEVVCDSSMAGMSGVRTYEIQVTPGRYKVAAKTSSATGYHDAYMADDHYNLGDIDICEERYHTPLVLEVVAGRELLGIHAGNFYYTPGAC